MKAKRLRRSRALLVAGAGLAAVGFSGAVGCGVSGTVVRDCHKHPEECQGTSPDLSVPLDAGEDLAQSVDAGSVDGSADRH